MREGGEKKERESEYKIVTRYLSQLNLLRNF